MVKKAFIFDFTPNAMKSPAARKQIENNLKEELIERVPSMIKREGKIHPFITYEIGMYSDLLKIARKTYIYGLYYATVSMIGVTAERFAFELSKKLRFSVNNNPVSKKELFGDNLSQGKRLKMLLKANIITQDVFIKLNQIRKIRNRYIHPEKKNTQNIDGIKILNLMIEILQSRFSEKFEFKNGKIIKRN